MRGDYIFLSSFLSFPRLVHPHVGTTAGRSFSTSASAGSPHVRGDYSARSFSTSASVGSPHVRGDQPAATSASAGSPHAWGLRRATPIRSQAFTPTCVGTTALLVDLSFQSPHVRGDYYTAIGPVLVFAGHPHVRGDYGSKRSRGLVGGSPRVGTTQNNGPARQWFAPRACVGTRTPHPPHNPRSRSIQGSPLLRAWDYVRGDRPGCVTFAGSPPTCVGTTMLSARRPCQSSRFTPTCVGDYFGFAP